jgi:hypothetical protein
MRLLDTAALWIKSRHLSKLQNGDISIGVANTLWPAKKYAKKVLDMAWSRAVVIFNLPPS